MNRIKLLLRVSVLSVWLPVLAATSYAATVTVSSVADSGPGTLRQAVSDASPGDTIDFALAGCPCTITLTSDRITIPFNVTIQGPGAAELTISGNNANAIFAGQFVNLAISGVTLAQGNSSGGAVFMWEGSLTLDGVHVTGNSMGTNGGGIFLQGGNHTIRDSTFSDNQGVYGGAVHNSFGMLTVVNSTFSGNSATLGGAIYNCGDLVMRNVTVTGNTATGSGGGVYGDCGTTFGTANSIIAANTASSLPDVGLLGSIMTSSGGNLFGSTATGNPIAYHPTDILNAAPSLGPLANNGGATPTHALLTGSPAIDAGLTALAVDPSTNTALAFDQRGSGFPRAAGSSVDIGAFELSAAPPPPPPPPPPPAFDFTGFFRPVLNAPEMNEVAAGSTVPIKFSLNGDHGLNIFREDMPSSTPLDCGVTAQRHKRRPSAQMDVSESRLTYDPATDVYTYSWKTNKEWSGTCRTFVLGLSDGSNRTLNFRFK